ncbi:lysosome-associated membrane glycoprotein 5 [Folsomia candida]|uniref:Lysosome-associated membrane glycoprotein 5 n=1 Tax=Folsomia candida TaxID=158441 RepID=A0A226DBX7_FOLCA|nr:lysosome-associated membrane glycoprotein 5 [Folsomia candida]OXA42683.1 Lysosome-associated membrane glycoprotein 5 [Folsomia candida]
MSLAVSLSKLCFFVCSSLVYLCTAQDAEIGGGSIFSGGVLGESGVAPTTTPEPPPTEYIVYDGQSMPCVLVRMNMKLIIEPKRTGNKKITISVPKSAVSKGSCGSGEDSKMTLTWGTFKFAWHFQKSRVSDAYYVDDIQLSYNTSDKAFGNATQDYAGQFQQVHSADPLTLFLTPIGRSYTCNMAKDVKLYDDKRAARVTVRLTRFQIQPFAAMTHRQYGDAFKCSEEAGRKDETVPLVVGSVLALAVLGTIGGYGGYRYVKVKKIEYDTME